LAVAVTYEWRGDFTTGEVADLHGEAFETDRVHADERDWEGLVARHSLGWVVARDEDSLVGFVNVIWDGGAHAWIQDTMVARRARRRGIGTRLVAMARSGARDARCQWLHVDFDGSLRRFYLDSCGFVASSAGLMALG
jgi:GNAT superfamily N-acetyltransferase